MIRRFIYTFAMKYRQFMVGRYGSDQLNLFLVISALVLTFLSRVPYLWFMYFVGVALLIVSVVRMFSRNISKRYNENAKFLKLKAKFMSWYKVRSDAFRNRKTHKYFRCKKCSASIRVPRGVGKVEVTCPVCRTKFIKKA